MNITLKLYATLTPYLPSGAQRNQAQIEVADGASVHDVLTARRVPMETCHLILVNGLFTPPRSAMDKQLCEGDVLAVWPPVAGG